MSRKFKAAHSLSRRDFFKVGAGFGVGAGILAACGPKATESLVEPTVGLVEPTEVMAEPTANLLAETSDVIFGAWSPSWQSSVNAIIAMEKGYLQEEGIDSVEIVIPGEQQIFPGLLGGSLHYAMHDSDAIANANLQGEPIYMLGCAADKENWMFCVEPGIETVQDLIGKDVSGGSGGSRNEANGIEMLRLLGLEDPENDVNWVPFSGGSDTRVEAVASGMLSGAVCWPRHTTIMDEIGGKVIFDELHSTPQSGICAYGPWMEENERTVIGLLKAEIRARLYVHDFSHKDEVISILEENDFDMTEFIDDYEVVLSRSSENLTFVPSEMDALLQQSYDLGLTPELAAWKDFCRLEYLNQAFEELGMDNLKMSI